MSTEQIVWLVVIVVAVLAVLVAVVAASRKSRAVRQERNRRQAEEIREEVAAGAPGLESARTDAEKARAQADAAHARAVDAERGAAQQEAELEDRVREADRLDPDVNHRSRDYEPDLDTVAAGAAATPDHRAEDRAAPERTEDPAHAASPSTEDRHDHEQGPDHVGDDTGHGSEHEADTDVAPRTQQDHPQHERPLPPQGDARTEEREPEHATTDREAADQGTDAPASDHTGADQQAPEDDDSAERHRGDAREDEVAEEGGPERPSGGSHRA